MIGSFDLLPLLPWLLLVGAIAVMLAIDLALHRDDHSISLREAAVWSGIWIAAGLGAGVAIWLWRGGEAAGAYYSAYLLEKALSLDNVFVFALIFAYFAVPPGLQHRVLFWGVIGALGMRLVFILVGAALLETFFWTAFLLGAFLIYTGWHIARHEIQPDPERNVLVRLLKRVVRVEPRYDGARFLVRRSGGVAATLLLVALVAIEATDLVFAIDSVAVVLAITTDTFIVWASIAFAVLGLRALYFCLSGLMDRFAHLRYGLGVILALAGVKLVLSETPVGKIPVGISLGAIVLVLGVAIGSSLWATRRRGGPPSGRAPTAPTAGGVISAEQR